MFVSQCIYTNPSNIIISDSTDIQVRPSVASRGVYMEKNLNCVSIHITDEELERLERVWREDLTVKSRCEFIKKALNGYTQKSICLTRRRGVASRLAE